jgi:uncharacterized protein (TIGR00730 family)
VRRLCVYCGAAAGVRPAYRAAGEELGRALGRRGLGLVYGGASRGLMGVVADAALAAGAEVIGVLPQGLDQREIAHRGITELRVVPTLHERKAQMAALADAFVALPGGIGTLDELFETATWNYLGLHDKPYAVLDVEGYWQPLLAALDRMVDEGFLAPATRARMQVHREVEALLDALLPA